MSVSSRLEGALPLLRSNVDRSGVLAMIVGTLITAWSGVLVRLIDVGPFAAGAWRVGLAAPALAALARLVQRDQRDAAKPGRSAGLLIFAGLAFALNIGFFHISLTSTKIANAAFIGAVGPIFTVIGGALFFRERSSSRIWLALGLALLAYGVARGSREVRYASAFFVVATTLKVFLYDLSGLEGALRAFSFIGLGLALIAIGLVYQKLVFAPARAVAAPADAPPS